MRASKIFRGMYGALGLAVLPVAHACSLKTFADNSASSNSNYNSNSNSSSRVSLKNSNVSNSVVNSNQNNSSNQKPKGPLENINGITIIAGSTSQNLTKQICERLHTTPENVEITMFGDGELCVEFKQSIRGKEAFIIQSLVASDNKTVNDNIMVLLLSITAARRAGASSITAVIPYFSYKHNRRRQALTTPYHTRFLWSTSADLAKMLQTMGVDKVISVDLQRPGQGHEAAFFDTMIPVETITTTNLFVDYLSTKVRTDRRLVIVSPNTENLKKANKFQKKLSAKFPGMTIDAGVFLSNVEKYSANATDSELLANVNNADVIVVDETVGKLHFI